MFIMTKNAKYNWHKNKLLPTTIKGYSILVGVILIATVLIVSSSVTLAAPFTAATSSNHDGTDIYPAPPAKAAASQTQFNLGIAYAYVGPAPSNTSYFSERFNATMYLAYQYPSKVLLNITRVAGVQITSCDAEIEVYGVKIAANTGATEYYTYSVGTSYNPSFSYSNESTLILHVHNLVDHNLYKSITGSFDFNWTANTSILSHTLGSIGWYTNVPNSGAGLSSAGIPNAISVTVYRIGYITMSNGSVSIYKDASTDNVIASVQLGNYEDGFLYNNLVPASELPQTDLFYPNTGT
jgi:hypothetical protein